MFPRTSRWIRNRGRFSDAETGDNSLQQTLLHLNIQSVIMAEWRKDTTLYAPQQQFQSFTSLPHARGAVLEIRKQEQQVIPLPAKKHAFPRLVFRKVLLKV